MNIRTIVLLLIVVATATLAALNWTTLSTPTLISLGFTVVTAPLGLIMLGLTALLGIMFLAYVLYLQSTVLMETRRHGKELQVQRELADKAEASRFTELRTFIEAQNTRASANGIDGGAAVLARLEQIERRLVLRHDQSDNATAAYVGQLEDRLERGSLAVVR